METFVVKVAIFENAIGFGGSTVCAEQLVKGCMASGGDPYLVSAYDSSRWASTLEEDHVYRLDQSSAWRLRNGLKSVSLDWAGPGKSVCSSVAFAASWYGCEWPLAIKVSRWLQSRGIEIIHANNDLLNNRMAIVAGRLAGIPVISHQRGTQWPGRFSSRLARGVARFVAISDFIAADLLNNIGDAHIVRIYDGVDMPDSNLDHDGQTAGIALRKKWSIPCEHTVFGFPGMFVEWKGHSLFLEAFAKIAQKHSDVHALIVGGDPKGGTEAERRIRAAVKQLHIDDRTIITGPVETINPFLQSMDVVINASTVPEPLGLTVLEAMVAGKPVVVPDSGGPAETVVSGETGLSFEIGRADSLAAAMERLLATKESWADMGAKGHDRVRQNFSLDRNRRAIQKLYSDVHREYLSQTSRGEECHSKPCYS